MLLYPPLISLKNFIISITYLLAAKFNVLLNRTNLLYSFISGSTARFSLRGILPLINSPSLNCYFNYSDVASTLR